MSLPRINDSRSVSPDSRTPRGTTDLAWVLTFTSSTMGGHGAGPIVHPRLFAGPVTGADARDGAVPPGDYAAGMAGEQREYAVAGRPDVRIHVRDLGLACCAVEFAAAIGRGLLVPAEVDSPGSAAVLVVSGTVTDALAPQVRAAWEALPEPKAAVSFGACSNSGGPYWDSYSVTKGVDQVIPVTTYVPGCPPRPEALVDALVSLVVPA